MTGRKGAASTRPSGQVGTRHRRTFTRGYEVEYLAGMQPHVEHIAEPELHRWAAEHPQAIIVHGTPEPGADDEGRRRFAGVGDSGTATT